MASLSIDQALYRARSNTYFSNFQSLSSERAIMDDFNADHALSELANQHPEATSELLDDVDFMINDGADNQEIGEYVRMAITNMRKYAAKEHLLNCLKEAAEFAGGDY